MFDSDLLLLKLPDTLMELYTNVSKVSKGAKIRNRYNQVPRIPVGK